MANNIKTQNQFIADAVLYNIEAENVIIQHTNMDYQSQFRESPIGAYGNVIEIVTTKNQGLANIFVDGQKVQVDDYSEGSVKLALDTIVDKTFKFTLTETEFNPGAIVRATKAASVSVLDRVEVQILKEIYRAARVLKTPHGTLEDQADFAAIERFANDNFITDSERVVFINSATKQSLTTATNIFTYSRGREDKYSDGVGIGNNDFENGNGLVDEIFGLPIYMSSKLTKDYLKKNVLAEIINGTTYLDTATAKVSNGILSLSVIQDDAFTIKAGSVLALDDGKQLVKISRDVVITAGSPRDVAVETIDEVEDVTANDVVLEDLSKFGNFIMSNKSVGFAMKALTIRDKEDQALSVDNNAGVSLRITRAYDKDYKSDMLSVDTCIGVKALVPEKIAIF